MSDERLTKSLFSARYTRFLSLLRQARLDAGLTQTEVARRLGKPQSFISKCESGERRVDAVEFLALCRVLGVEAAKMLRAIESPPAEKARSSTRKERG